MTDNGSAYRSHAFRHACAAAGLRHLRTRPYTPRTNGKAERFLQTVMRECAYADPSRPHGSALWHCPAGCTSTNPSAACRPCRPTTITRLAMNNLLGNDS